MSLFKTQVALWGGRSQCGGYNCNMPKSMPQASIPQENLTPQKVRDSLILSLFLIMYCWRVFHQTFFLFDKNKKIFAQQWQPIGAVFFIFCLSFKRRFVHRPRLLGMGFISIVLIKEIWITTLASTQKFPYGNVSGQVPSSSSNGSKCDKVVHVALNHILPRLQIFKNDTLELQCYDSLVCGRQPCKQ